jgi:tRNA (guanine-N7-)-methyltransferase
MDKQTEHPTRSIRSFVRRTGRLTPGQEKALDELWPVYGIDYTPVPLALSSIFEMDQPTILEIGFGNGESLVALAKDNRDRNYIGVEVHEPGVGHCMMQADEADLNNLRLISHDAIDVLQQQIPDQSLVRVNLYFPDPWPKKRHHKRRILQHPFLELVAARLNDDGMLHIATDWENYAEHIDELIAESELFDVDERREHEGENALDRPVTKFEQRGLRKGHKIFDWRLRKL